MSLAGGPNHLYDNKNIAYNIMLLGRSKFVCIDVAVIYTRDQKIVDNLELEEVFETKILNL